MIETLRCCLRFVDQTTRRQAVVVGALILFGTALETMGIALIFPFISLVTDASRIHEAAWLVALVGPIATGEERSLLMAIAGGLIALFVFKNLFLTLVYYRQARFVGINEYLLARRLLSIYLDGAYVLYLTRNSAELIRNVNVAVNRAFGAVFMGFLTLGSELLLVAALSVVLLIANPVVTLSAVILLSLALGIFYRAVNRHYVVWGAAQLRIGKETLQILQQAFHGIKEIKIRGAEGHIRELYATPRHELAKNEIAIMTMNNMPRLWVESLMVIGVLSVVLVNLGQGNDAGSILATLSLFAAVALRLIPSMNRIMLAMTGIKNGQEAVRTIDRDIAIFSMNARETVEETSRPLPFQREIELKGVSFHYPDTTAATLEGIDLTIRRGESIGIVGPSGAGKTTLVDLILGLLDPSSGQILVDGADIATLQRAWQRRIGYVPQKIALFDDSICRNIAMGLNDIDIDRRQVQEAMKLAQLDTFVASLPEGMDTIVGEQGVRLSGGQQQRIGIARALFHDPDVLIFDEATSALDNETEREVQKAIDAFAGNKTIIVIAHRLSTVKRCDRLIMMKEGRIAAMGSYEELMTRNPDFQRVVGFEAA